MTCADTLSAGGTAWKVLAIGLALSFQAAAAATPGQAVFQIEDASGLTLSDRGWLPDAHLVVAGDTPAPAQSTTASAKRITSGVAPELAQVIARAAQTHGLAPALLHAVIAVESGYVTDAVSTRGAMGLMQLMPATAREYGVTQPFDPVQNVNAGAKHLRRLLDQFGQDTARALAAYNAGAGAVRRHAGGMPPYAETLAYVPRVLQRMAPRTHAATTPN